MFSFSTINHPNIYFILLYKWPKNNWNQMKSNKSIEETTFNKIARTKCIYIYIFIFIYIYIYINFVFYTKSFRRPLPKSFGVKRKLWFYINLSELFAAFSFIERAIIYTYIVHIYIILFYIYIYTYYIWYIYIYTCIVNKQNYVSIQVFRKFLGMVASAVLS